MIEKIKLIKGSYYFGSCRNTKIALWDGEKFIHIAYEFTHPYIEDIKHYDDVRDINQDGFIPISLINIDYDQIKKEKSYCDYNNSARKIYMNINLKDLNGEEWRGIGGYKHYEVSNYGRVKNIKSNIIMKQNFSRNYLVMGLTNNLGVRKTVRVHRLVAEAFCEKPNYDKYEVNHINGITADNRLLNLEYTTHKNNSEKNFTSGNYYIKLKPNTVKEIKELLNNRTMAGKDIAKKYGVSPSIISEIKTNKKWVGIN